MDETVSIFSIIIVSIKGSSHTYGFGLVWKEKQYFKGIDSLSTGRQERKPFPFPDSSWKCLLVSKLINKSCS